MKLKTERLLLLARTEENVEKYFDDSKEVGPHISMHLKELKENPTSLGWGVWLVIDTNDKLVGDIGFKGKPNDRKEVEVGYGILPSAQNKGYATEAVNEIITWALSNDQVEKVRAECLGDNFPSIRVLEKLNMKRVAKEDQMLKWELVK